MMAVKTFWDSPLVGAFLLRFFVDGFSLSVNHGPNLLQAFPALTWLGTPTLFAELPNSCKGLNSFEDFEVRLIKSRKQHILALMMETMRRNREWVRDSIEMACAVHLIRIDTATGNLIADRELPYPPKTIARNFRKKTCAKAKLLGRLMGKRDVAEETAAKE